MWRENDKAVVIAKWETGGNIKKGPFHRSLCLVFVGLGNVLSITI